jgi:hypothetical protein
MHFRIRKHIVQLVRTSYDPDGKKPKAKVVGRMPLSEPKLTWDLKRKLTEDEVAEVEGWIEGQYRLNSLKEALAALTLADSISAANRWFSRNPDSPVAAATALQVLPEFKALRKILRTKGLLG